MPAITSGIIGATLSAGLVGLKYGAVKGLIAFTVSAVSVIAQRFLLADNSIGAGIPGTTQIARTESADAEWVFGEVRKAGTLAYLLNSGGKKTKQHLLMRLLVAQGECEELTQIFVGKDKLAFSTTNIPVAVGHHSSRFIPRRDKNPALLPDSQGKLHRPTRAGNELSYADGDREDEERVAVMSMLSAKGDQGQHLTDWCRVTDVPRGQGRWTANHKLTGISYYDVYYFQPKSNFWSTIPETTIVLKGAKLTWPGQDTAIWTDNPAVIAWWYLTERKRVPVGAIDLDDFYQSYAVCDEDVTYNFTDDKFAPYNGTRKRYRFNGIIRSGDPWLDVRSEIEEAMSGIIYERAGIWHIRAGVDRMPSFVLTDDDVLQGTVEIIPQSHELYNCAIATLSQNEFDDWQEMSIEFEDAEALAQDGERKPRNFGSLTSISDPIQAYRFLRSEVIKNRKSMRLRCQLHFGDRLQWLALMPGDIGRVRLLREGIQNLLFEIEGFPVIDTENELVTLELKETTSSVYDDVVDLPPLLPRDVDVIDNFDFQPVPTNLQVGERKESADENAPIAVYAAVDNPQAT